MDRFKLIKCWFLACSILSCLSMLGLQNLLLILFPQMLRGLHGLQMLWYIVLYWYELYSSQVKLHLTKNALRLIARKAISKNTGARGLRSLLENILMDAMYEVRKISRSFSYFYHYASYCSIKHLELSLSDYDAPFSYRIFCRFQMLEQVMI